MKIIPPIITLLIFTTGLTQNYPIDFETGGFGDVWTWTVFENDTNPPLEIIANPYPSGINTSAKVAKFTALDLGMPFTGVESMHGTDIGTFNLNVTNAIVKIMVYKTKISDIGIKYVTPSGGAQPELKVANTLVNQWELITIDFSSYIGLGETTELDQIVIFPDFIDREADDVIYFDNITFEPSEEIDIIQIPIDFELTTNYGIIGFEGAESLVEPNPDVSGINESTKVVRTIKAEGSQFFAGTSMGLDMPIDFTASELISLKTWSPKADIPVRLKLEAAGGVFIELDVNTTLENQWETLTWDFTGQTAGIDFTTVVVFFEFVIDLPGDGTTYYYDDIEVGTSLGFNYNKLQSIICYPNPFKAICNLKADEIITQLTIYDIFGQNILSLQPNSLEISLNLSGLKPGIYFSLIESEKGNKVIKLLKG
tara:strand:+ start:169 stop:1446 length:1278 start_codon:yes stop_codon:yes gene_type:complete